MFKQFDLVKIIKKNSSKNLKLHFYLEYQIYLTN